MAVIVVEIFFVGNDVRFKHKSLLDWISIATAMQSNASCLTEFLDSVMLSFILIRGTEVSDKTTYCSN